MSIPKHDHQADTDDFLSQLQLDKHFLALFYNAPTGCVLADQRGQFLLVNDSFSQMIGYSQQELLRKSYADITHPDDLQASNQLNSALQNSNEFFRLKKRYRHKDGHIIWVDISVSG